MGPVVAKREPRGTPKTLKYAGPIQDPERKFPPSVLGSLLEPQMPKVEPKLHLELKHFANGHKDWYLKTILK